MKMRLWAVAALCVLSGSAWILKQAWPSELGWPFNACIHYAFAGCVGIGFIAVSQRRNSGPPRQLPALGFAGLCLLVLPSAALEFAAGKLPESTIAAVFCAVPLITILAATCFGLEINEASRLRSLITPSLVGLGGALLLFPVNDPGSPRKWLYLAFVFGACVMVAAASVWMHRLMQGVGIAAAIAVIGVCSSAALGLYGASHGWPTFGANAIASELVRGAVFDLPELWLLIWLLREVTPSRLSARFLLAPLITVAEGYAVERGPLSVRVVLAVALLCIGGLTMLLRDEPEELPGLRLR